MADRFPSLEDFSEGQTEVVEKNSASEDDFLARERAALGEDADQFATPQDHIAAVGSGDDLLGGGDDTPAEELGQFESSFPSVETQAQNERVAPGGTITGTGSPFPATGSASLEDDEEEPEPIRLWREKRDAELARRAEISQEKKEATLRKAKQDIDDFYVAYNNKIDKQKAQARAEAEQFLASREDTSAGGTSWERIAKLVDVSGKGSAGGDSSSGKHRFREMLVDLRKDKDAPGASGV
ncbi:Clathrin light chain [Penicillium subrubescens]|uniref:Clathrin light chain n=1 Tax=Penicillium subrubescens TaxID=1316194 RepID=A0A1Q5U835_9EURO|nr:Clathrin light chain [Penicillium subrubescens]KAJ5911223.1 Clathrin light chain [Penicillium subrubescens]OKP08614.1 Clathrin light chain [Penicillium subrubescens]